MKNIFLFLTFLFSSLFLLPLSISARVDQQPDLYRSQEEKVTFSSTPPFATYKTVPTNDLTVRHTLNWNYYMTHLNKMETGAGFYTPHLKKYSNMDGYHYRIYLTNDRVDQPMYFYPNYINDQNYQLFSCQLGTCTFQQLIQGQPVYSQLPTSQNPLPYTSQTNHYIVEIFASHHQISLNFCPFMTTGYDCNYATNITVELDPSRKYAQNGNLMLFSYWPLDYLNESYQPITQSFFMVEATGYQLKSDLISNIYRQTDVRWGDHQLGGGPRTIYTHGCALTSASMILNYWGHSLFKQRLELITPGNLNQWLKEQPDGYLDEDSLNWVAVTRYARINKKYTDSPTGPNLPNLEFSSLNGDRAQAAFAEDLAAGRPSVFRLNQQTSSGYHFMVGINSAGNDPDQPEEIRIADPYYDGYHYLSEQTDKTGPINGVRRFVPSYTDLSQILFYSSSADLKFTLTDLNQAQLNFELEAFTDQISDPNSGETQSPLYQYLLTKPDTGHYQLTVTNHADQPTSFKAAFYDLNADLTWWDENDRHLDGHATQFFQLDYQKEIISAEDNIAPLLHEVEHSLINNPESQDFSWDVLRDQLNQALTNHSVMTFLHRYLTTLADDAQTAEEENPIDQLQIRSRYLSFFKKVINKYLDLSQPYFNLNQKPFLTQELWTTLTEIIDQQK